MRLDEKRKVIEVLLCARNEHGIRIMNIADYDLQNTCYSAFEDVRESLTDEVLDGMISDNSEYWYTATEAAYRLIESSPTLRREWFGGAR